ncbi:MAG: hypothetical protein ACYCTB_07360 [bacterium]
MNYIPALLITELKTFRKNPTTKIMEKISKALDFPDYIEELKSIIEKQYEEIEALVMTNCMNE